MNLKIDTSVQGEVLHPIGDIGTNDMNIDK